MVVRNHQSPATRVCLGRILQVDAVNRTIRAHTEADAIVDINLAFRCLITLNGEPVRLRLLEEGDDVEALLCESSGQFTAIQINARTPQSRERHRHLSQMVGGDVPPVVPPPAVT